MTTLDDFRVGVVRESMTRNRLIAKDELGKPKKTLFNNPPGALPPPLALAVLSWSCAAHHAPCALPAADLVFGMPERKEEESVRDVVFMWKDGETTLDGVPGPDFRAMDKGAVGAGLTRSTDFRDFRRTNPATLRTGRDKMRASRRSMLPSDRDPMHTYGCPR